MEDLKPVAREALDAFESIAASAREGLSRRGVTLDSFAMVNEATADKLSADLRERNEDRVANLQRLRHEPAIARLVIEDEDESQQTLYISPAGTVPSAKVALCSYMSPKGRLAPRDIGEEVEVPLPGGSRWFLLREKLTFKTLEDGAGWDSQPAVQFREDAPPRSFKSLRDLLREEGYSEEQIDALGAWLEEGDTEEGAANEYEGIKRDALTAMQLRIAPILDKFQDGIFRLPIDRQIAVFGPPGTGKTTTMVRRLRQKLDLAYLDEDEQALVERPGSAGLAHADSWILFTPTELLRLYVKEAASKEGVPAHDERLQTWDDYRWGAARNVLGILRKGSGGGFTMPLPAVDRWLADGTLLDQPRWFDAFDRWQADDFVQQLKVEAERLAKGDNERAAFIGQRVEAAIARSGVNIVQLLGELAGLRADLIQIARTLGEGTKGALAQPLRALAAEDDGFLDALAAMVTAMLAEQPEDEEADDGEEDDTEDEVDTEETRSTLQGRRLVADVFQRAMRTLALQQASGRKPSTTSRAGRILAFLEERGLASPDLKEVGKILLLQRAAGRLGNAPASYLRRFPGRYRRFRRAMRADGLWYGVQAGKPSQVHPAEVDLVMLAMLRAAAGFEADRLLSSRLAERRPALLDAIGAMRRNQVLVDEATDFSPLQLACMAALANPATGSLFLSGDFNQRLTMWGSRSKNDLAWVAPQLETHPISVTYRQSRKLSAFARKLAELQGAEIDAAAPDYGENLGYDPVKGLSLDSDDARAEWLVARIEEIQGLSDGNLPTIAVLVPDQNQLPGLTAALNARLADLSLKAKAYADGEAIGKSNDVRVFPIQHIKGLEFEAVFFLDVDRLAALQPEMIDRYIYVGATRAATFLGLTCSGPTLPTALTGSDLSYGQNW
ncbi:MAG: DNA helicase UvrD [Citromicrobium sp.]|nr:MAG: DNA helicase UvrD [Citromicrobium sp.]